jgi:hypothetical protein
MEFRLDELPSEVALANATGPLSGAPTLKLPQPNLAPGESVTVTTSFLNPNRVAITYTPALIGRQSQGD